MIDTALPSEFADKPGLIRQSVLKPIFIGMFIWPAILAWLLRHADADPIAALLQQYFVVPPSLKNFTDYWFKGELVSKSVYLSCWYVNALVIGGYQVISSIHFPGRIIRNLRSYSIFRSQKIREIKWIFSATFTTVFSLFVLSPIFYDPDRILSAKQAAAIFNNAIFYGVMWGIYPMSVVGLVMGPFIFFEAANSFRKG